MSKLLHVAFGFHGESPGIEAIQGVISKSGGWARYAPNCWIVATADEPQVLASRLRKICKEEDSIYVVEMNPRHDGGFLLKEIWDWLRPYKNR